MLKSDSIYLQKLHRKLELEEHWPQDITCESLIDMNLSNFPPGGGCFGGMWNILGGDIFGAVGMFLDML